MHKTSVYTLVNGNIKELAHRKQQRSQKVILPASHWLCVNVLLNRPKSPPWRYLHKILHDGSPRRRNQPHQILSQSDQGFWFCGGSNFWFSHKKEKSPLTQGLNYRSACDRKWHLNQWPWMNLKGYNALRNGMFQAISNHILETVRNRAQVVIDH